MKPRRERKVYYAHYERNADPHPLIRIAGKFLEKLEFRIDDLIQVEYSVGTIVITKKEVILSDESQKNKRL